MKTKQSLRKNEVFGKHPFASAFALVLTLSSALLVYAPTTNAQTPTFPTHAFLSVSPNPVGVNQEATILMWLIELEPTAAGPEGNRWQNYSLQITKPDGQTQTLGPFTADDAAFAWTTYKPDQTGEYKLKFSFSGQQVNIQGTTIAFGASSFTTNLTVQQNWAETTPQAPIPTDYWKRPVNAQNQQWYTISGNWLGTGSESFGDQSYNSNGNFNPYTTAPNTAHIIWARPIDFGGLIGGEFGGTSTSNYYTGKSYEPKFTPPIIINGVLYYNVPSPPREGFYAVDLRTGETLWWQNGTGSAGMIGTYPMYGFAGITMGQVLNYQSPNQIGAFPYLWYTIGSKWYMYDAVTGNMILTVKNAVTGTTIQGPNGELLVYILDGTKNWLAMWNSTKCIGISFPFNTGLWAWRPPVGATLEWKRGVQWNVTTQSYPGQTIAKINSGIILATNGDQAPQLTSQMEIAYDSTTGSQIWAVNRTKPSGTNNYGLMGPLMDGIYTEFDKTTMQWSSYSATNGQKVWGPSTPYTNAWGSLPQPSQAAYETLFGMSVDGIHALDLQTGNRLWDFYADNSGVDFPGFNTYPFLGASATIADDKMFAATGNSHGDPLFRGAKLYSINATSGKEIWSINGFYLGTMPIADGILVALNGYDNQIYAFSKGKSATTVSAPDLEISAASKVLIKGIVTDQSPGTTALGIPAAGTPAISDESMSEWMEYLYMQQPKPTNATGVKVHLTAIDPNGNFQDMGYATSDDSGFYSATWTPPVAGKYVVTATFEGSESYYVSSAKTAFVVAEASEQVINPTPTPSTATPTSAPTTAQTTTMEPSSSPSLYVPPAVGTPTTTYIAIGAAVIVIVAAAAALVLRRRK